MTTISDFMKDLPNKGNEVIRQQLLNKLDPVLKQRMLDAGGDITIDLQNGTYSVSAGNDELEKEIMADLKAKK